MFLARELKMTRRSLLASMDSYELTMWQAFFKAENAPAEKKQTPVELSAKLMSAFMGTKMKRKKK